MSAKPKKTKKSSATPLRPDSIPALDLYAGLPLDNKSQHDCLVLDKHGAWFRFPSVSHCTIVTNGIESRYAGFTEFHDRVTPVQATELHKLLFDAEIPKSVDDWTILRLIVWKGLCVSDKVKNRMEKPVAVSAKTGEARVKKLANREYVLLSNDCSVKIPQAMACFRILVDNVEEVNGERRVKEDLLKAKVYERAAELHTKQDAWRIFQYYRPRMIEAKVLRLV